MSIDRSEVARALARAIAYKQCGKDREAAEWAEERGEEGEKLSKGGGKGHGKV
jgi:hypothetical protein